MSGFLPEQPTAWKNAASQHGVSNSWITARNSGSEFTYTKFLMLRALWPRKTTDAELIDTRTSPNLQKRYEQARQALDGSPDWQTYLASLDRDRAVSMSRHSVNVGGVYSVPRYYQFLSTQEKARDLYDWATMAPKVAMLTRQAYQLQHQQTTPTRAGRSTTNPDSSPGGENLTGTIDNLGNLNLTPPNPPSSATGYSVVSSSGSYLSPCTSLHSWGFGANERVEDEQIINTALTINCPDVKDHWSLYRKAFTYCTPNGVKVYEARVDGLLRSEDEECWIIVEVKPCYRYFLDNCRGEGFPKKQIRMQERQLRW